MTFFYQKVYEYNFYNCPTIIYSIWLIMSIRENMIDLYECDKQLVTVCYIKYLWAIEKKN